MPRCFGATCWWIFLPLTGCHRSGEKSRRLSVFPKGELAEIHGHVSGKRLHAGGSVYEPHTVGRTAAHSSPGPCAFRLWHMDSAVPDSHTHTHSRTRTLRQIAFKASRRSARDRPVLLMSGAQSKQGHLCRTSQGKEKSHRRNIVAASFNSLFLPQKSQLAGQIISPQQTASQHKYPQRVSVIVDSPVVCWWCIGARQTQCKSDRGLTLSVLPCSLRPEKQWKSDICPFEQRPTNKQAPGCLIHSVYPFWKRLLRNCAGARCKAAEYFASGPFIAVIENPKLFLFIGLIFVLMPPTLDK